jgi:hypothetical protein
MEREMNAEDFDSDWGDEPTKHDIVAQGPMEVIDLTIRMPSAIDQAQAVAADMWSLNQVLEAKADLAKLPTLELACVCLTDEETEQ